MSQLIAIVGPTGSGKTRSLQTLNPEETFLINVTGKPPSFGGWRKKYIDYKQKGGNLRNLLSSNPKLSFESKKRKEGIGDILESLPGFIMSIPEKRPEVKTIVIDDAQYLMSYELFMRAKEKGYEKYVDIATHMFDLIYATQALPDNINVIYTFHSEDISIGGEPYSRIKTIGKMIDEKLTLEGLFTIVLHCRAKKTTAGEIEHVFITNTDGSTSAKSPEMMFPEEIPNDMQYVLDKIYEYEN